MVKIEQDVNLARYTTIGVGGNAEYFARACNREELLELLDYAYKNDLIVQMLGGGSNVLISDAGLSGLTILNKARKTARMLGNLTVESGVVLSKLAKDSLESGLSGLEWASGIPGTIGGAIVSNAGALGGQIADVLVSAEVWHAGELMVWHNSDFGFDYRSSRLKGERGYYIVTAEFHLQQMKRGLAEEPGFYAREDVFEKVADDKKRRAQSYVGRTAGSYFKNPEGFTAAELIDRAGLKGHRVGGVEVSFAHANVFRNFEDATATDVYGLEKYVIKTVKDKFGVTLEPEVVKVGKF